MDPHHPSSPSPFPIEMASPSVKSAAEESSVVVAQQNPRRMIEPFPFVLPGDGLNNGSAIHPVVPKPKRPRSAVRYELSSPVNVSLCSIPLLLTFVYVSLF
jgi:hypothetical protein